MSLKNIFLSIIIFFQIDELTYCQPVYFNDIYHLGDSSTWCAAKTLKEELDGYIICGKAGHEIGIIKLNESGEQIWSKTWGDSLSSWYIGYPGSLQSINNQHYLTCSKNFYSRIRQISFVMHFNNDWDTTWTKEYDFNYDENPDTNTLIQNMALCDNRDLIFTGSLYRPDLGARILLLRCDSLGNILWNKLYYVSPGSQAVNGGYSVVQTTDGGFAIGGYYYIFGNEDSGDPIIVKTDSLGNKEWLKNLGGIYEDDRAMLCLADDGNILMCTTITDYASGGTLNATISVTKLDNDGNIIWNNKYGQSLISNSISNIRVLADGSIICVGYSRSEVPWISGWILKLNHEGDSLWYREYYILSGGSTYNRLADVVPTEDSGLISCGYVAPAPPDPGIQSAWVIKLDSIGCEFAGCDSTVGIVEQEGMEAWGQGGLEISPNPARDWINITLPDILAKGEVEIKVYDVFGRVVMKKGKGEGGKANRAFLLEVSGFASGIYIAVVKDQKGRRSTGKFVIQ